MATTRATAERASVPPNPLVSIRSILPVLPPAERRVAEGVLARPEQVPPLSIGELARLFPAASSVDVQRAIAAVLIRADYQQLAKPEFVRVLSQNRRKSPDGTDIIDILIRRLRAPDQLPQEQE